MKYCISQWQRLAKELEENFNSMNLMSQKVKDYATKVLTKEQSELKEKRAKKERREKKCNNSHNIFGAINSSQCN